MAGLRNEDVSAGVATDVPVLQAMEVREPQLPENIWIPVEVKFVPKPLSVIVDAVFVIAVNLYHTS